MLNRNWAVLNPSFLARLNPKIGTKSQEGEVFECVQNLESTKFISKVIRKAKLLSS